MRRVFIEWGEDDRSFCVMSDTSEIITIADYDDIGHSGMQAVYRTIEKFAKDYDIEIVEEI